MNAVKRLVRLRLIRFFLFATLNAARGPSCITVQPCQVKDSFWFQTGDKQQSCGGWTACVCLTHPPPPVPVPLPPTLLCSSLLSIMSATLKLREGVGGKTEKCTNPSKKRLEEREKNTLEDKSHYDNAVSFSVCLPTSPCVLPHLLHHPPLPFSPPPHHKQPQWQTALAD